MAKSATVKKLSIEKFRAYGSARKPAEKQMRLPFPSKKKPARA